MELALPLLDLIAPDVEPPISYRQGGAPPRFVRVAAGELLDVALLEAAGLDGLVAVIAPPSLAGGASGETFDESSVPILTPRQAKGLEFDHVVVVEPALIVDEGGDSGLRELYVALTRPTKTLSIVHAGPLPDALA
jgi:superfamily I DNA/RNA helicase